jgi:hypothetical protein
MNDEGREKTYELAQELTNRFIKRNGTIVCRELLGHDLRTEQGRDAVAEQNLFMKRCPKFVRDAAEILEELL